MPIKRYVSEEGISAMIWCALRFDGYKYLEVNGQSGDDPMQTLATLSEPFLRTLVFHRVEEINFAAFFWLQRYFKWKEDYFVKDSREHVVFDMLFLHLYRIDVPVIYRSEEWYSKWQSEYKVMAEDVAGMVRNSFRRSIRTAIQPKQQP
jgi:hypothetical protein